jgi:hypothetical protein
VDYLNVTDSNLPYPYVLNGCPDSQCPFDKFTSIYQPRFPASAAVECARKDPPMTSTMPMPPKPPSRKTEMKFFDRIFILYFI